MELSVSSGTAEGFKFHQWHSNDYLTQVVAQWLRFLNAAQQSQGKKEPSFTNVQF